MLLDFILAFLLAGLASAFFFGVFRKRRSKTMFIASFALLFLMTWAGGVWLGRALPGDRSVWGQGSWLIFLCVSVVFGLILSFLMPSRDPFGSKAAQAVAEETQATAVLGLFYWLLITGMVAVILLHYLLPPLVKAMIPPSLQ